MKTIMDYLRKNGQYYYSTLKNQFHLVKAYDSDDVFLTVRIKHDEDVRMHCRIDSLLDRCGVEIRFCGECGAPMDEGYMCHDGGWRCCEKCFEESMNASYPNGWRETEEKGEFGGYYEAKNDAGEWGDTGIFWTSWY